MRKNSLDYKTILNLYLAMPRHSRSIRSLHRQLLHKYKQMINDQSISIPHLNTLWNWASKNNWKKLSDQQNLIVEDKVNQRIVNKQITSEEKFQSIMQDLQEVSYLTLKKIVATLKQNLLKPIETASELKALCNSVTDVLKQFSVLSGGVSSRSESITHNLNSNNPKVIREEIMKLISSLATEDGISIKELDKPNKDKLN